MTDNTTIHGIVIPAAWNEKGEVVSVIVAAYDEEKYLVENSEKGRELMSLLRQRVVVNGLVKRRKPLNVIEINAFRVDTSSA